MVGVWEEVVCEFDEAVALAWSVAPVYVAGELEARGAAGPVEGVLFGVPGRVGGGAMAAVVAPVVGAGENDILVGT